MQFMTEIGIDLRSTAFDAFVSGYFVAKRYKIPVDVVGDSWFLHRMTGLHFHTIPMSRTIVHGSIRHRSLGLYGVSTQKVHVIGPSAGQGPLHDVRLPVGHRRTHDAQYSRRTVHREVMEFWCGQSGSVFEDFFLGYETVDELVAAGIVRTADKFQENQLCELSHFPHSCWYWTSRLIFWKKKDEKHEESLTNKHKNKWRKKKINQSINRTNNRTINRTNNRTINQSIEQSNDQSIEQSSNQSITQSINQSIDASLLQQMVQAPSM